MASIGPAPLFTNNIKVFNDQFAPTITPHKVTSYPTTTGGAVYAIKFEGGVIMGADTLGSYGGTARYMDLRRVVKVNDTTVIGCSGDLADFQYITEMVNRMQIEEERTGNEISMQPRSLHRYLTRYLYGQRSEFDPKWTNIVVGGIQDDEPFLGFVSMIGAAFQEDAIGTGLGGELALPLMRKLLEKQGDSAVPYEKARSIMEESIKLGFLSDCKSTDRYQFAVITNEGVKMEEPKIISATWDHAKDLHGF